MPERAWAGAGAWAWGKTPCCGGVGSPRHNKDTLILAPALAHAHARAGMGKGGGMGMG